MINKKAMALSPAPSSFNNLIRIGMITAITKI
jgi:hypothetical protein